MMSDYFLAFFWIVCWFLTAPTVVFVDHNFQPAAVGFDETVGPEKSHQINKGSNQMRKVITTLQSKMDAKLSLHRFCPCHENGLIKTIQTRTHNICESQIDFPLL